MSVLVWLGLQLLVLPPSWTRPVLALLFPVLLLARQDRQRVLDLEVGGGCEDGCCDLVVPGERLDAVLVEAAQEAAQPHLLEVAVLVPPCQVLRDASIILVPFFGDAMARGIGLAYTAVPDPPRCRHHPRTWPPAWRLLGSWLLGSWLLGSCAVGC